MWIECRDVTGREEGGEFLDFILAARLRESLAVICSWLVVQAMRGWDAADRLEQTLRMFQIMRPWSARPPVPLR
jgi:hypothetical protein